MTIYRQRRLVREVQKENFDMYIKVVCYFHYFFLERQNQLQAATQTRSIPGIQVLFCKISVGILVGETIPDRENSRFMLGFPLSRDNFYSFTKRKFSLALRCNSIFYYFHVNSTEKTLATKQIANCYPFYALTITVGVCIEIRW